MEIAKHTIKKAVQAIQELEFREDICRISRYIQKRLRDNDIARIMSMERQDFLLAVYGLLHHSQPTTACVERSFFHAAKPVS